MDKKDETFGSKNIDTKDLEDQAQASGLTYNQAIEWMARKTGGHGTEIYSDTDAESVKQKNEQSESK